MAGVSGRRRVEEDTRMAAGAVGCVVWVRQGRVPVRLFGAIVRAMAYESRR